MGYVIYKHRMLWQICFSTMNFVWTALTSPSPSLPPLRATKRLLSHSEHGGGWVTRSAGLVSLYHHLHGLFALQGAKCLIVNFRATMTNTAPSALNPSHTASLTYCKCKPSLRVTFCCCCCFSPFRVYYHKGNSKSFLSQQSFEELVATADLY